MSHVKKIVLCAMCIALCYVLPVAFHAVGLGGVLSPMHIPVLLCGIICGGGYGFLCGLLGPILSSLLSSMPPLTMLVRMVPELCAYGLVSGIMMSLVHTKSQLELYISLVTAMIVGRIVGGIATAIFFMATSGVYSVSLWATGYFVEGLPGIVAHLILVPILVITLERIGAVPDRAVVEG